MLPAVYCLLLAACCLPFTIYWVGLSVVECTAQGAVEARGSAWGAGIGIVGIVGIEGIEGIDVLS